MVVRLSLGQTPPARLADLLLMIPSLLMPSLLMRHSEALDNGAARLPPLGTAYENAHFERAHDRQACTLHRSIDAGRRVESCRQELCRQISDIMESSLPLLPG
jgi:hypothetical protein